jgi:T-complex protein 1 subunit zeta
MKLLVSGAGDVKMTKDGNVLLNEMQIQHPTAALIARAATAQDKLTGDGTTSTVLLTGELLRQSENYVDEGLHPRLINEGFHLARERALEFLEKFKVEKDTLDRELLLSVARTSLLTKVNEQVTEKLAEIVVDAVLTIRKEGQPIDLFMVETMVMKHKSALETRLVKGLVLDHGARHPDMPKRLKNAYVLTMNVSLEYEKPESTAVVVYKSAKEREKMIEAEHALVDEKVRQIIELKRLVCGSKDSEYKNFVVINQKGIDPMALDMFAKEDILALRRAKRRNMERCTLACGGMACNSTDDLDPSVLGKAGLVFQYQLGEEKYTFIEEVENPFSCTVVMRGVFDHTLHQLQDAVRDGLRAVKNAIEDKALVPGGGAFEAALSAHIAEYSNQVRTQAKFGLKAFSEALLIIPKTLAENSGLSTQECILAMQQEIHDGNVVGLDIETGEPMDPETEGIWDCYRVKRQMLHSATVIAQQLLLVDEIMKAGKAQSAPGGPGSATGGMMPGM